MLAVLFFSAMAFTAHAADNPFDQAEELWSEGNVEQAIWEYRKLLGEASLSEEERAFGLFRLAMAQMASGQQREAQESYQRVEQSHPDHPLAPLALLFQANYSLLEGSQLSNGVRMYEDLIQRYPRSDAARQVSEWLPELKKMNQSELRASNIKRKRREAEAERQAAREERQTRNRESQQSLDKKSLQPLMDTDEH